MKKRIIAIMLVGILGSVGCININYTVPETEEKTEEVVQEDVTEMEENSVKENVSATVYYPDEMAEDVLSEEVECEVIDENILWDLLKEKSIIKDECEINAFKKEGSRLELDVNEAFGNQLRSQGTSGERMLLMCVVNTFLDSFHADEIKITENGDTLYSGHAEYTDYFTKYE